MAIQHKNRARAETLFLGTLFLCWAAAPPGNTLRADDPLPPMAVARLGGLSQPEGQPPIGHTGSIYNLAFSPDGAWLASRGSDNGLRVKIWDVAGRRIAREVDGDGKVLAFSRDGGLLLTGGPDDCLHLWDPATGEEKKLLAVREASLAGFLEGDKQLAVLSRGNVLYFDVATGKMSKRVGGLLTGGSALSPDVGTLACLGVRLSEIRLYDTLQAQEKRRLKNDLHTVRTVAFSPDARLVAAAGYIRQNPPRNGQSSLHLIRLWDLEQRKQLFLNGAGHTKLIYALAFSPDGRFLVSAGFDQSLRVWEIASGAEVRTLAGHTKPVFALAFSPDGRRLASAGADRTILLWDVDAATLGNTPAGDSLDEAKLAALWNDLAESGGKSGTGLAATGALKAVPDQAVALVNKRLGDFLALGKQDRIAELIRQLDADEFKTREHASEELLALRTEADSALRKALKQTASPEVRHRIRLILAASSQTAPRVTDAELLRYRRVVLLLERINSPPARKLLSLLAEQFPSETVNQEAKAALARVGRPST